MTDLSAPSTAALVAELVRRGVLDRQPCHITGMHTPDHHIDHDCRDMHSETLERLLGAAGVAYDDLPARLHDDCGWCHRVPGQEHYRDRLRRSWAWAGVAITDELAAPGYDVPQPGDEPVILALWADGAWGNHTSHHEDELPFHWERACRVRDLLVEQGLLEVGNPESRLVYSWRITDAGREALTIEHSA